MRVRSDGVSGTTFTIIMNAKIEVSHLTSILEESRMDSGSDIGGSTKHITKAHSSNLMSPRIYGPGMERKGTDTDMSDAGQIATELGFVLIVDDSALNRKMVRCAIRKHSSDIIEVVDNCRYCSL